jgi:glyoxylase-like metal-dependent hydrolase (beta-lactamase superfamily II)
MTDYVIYPLDMGDIQLDSSFVNWQTACGTPIWTPTTAWLITGGDRPILVDTSFRDVADASQKQGLTCRRSPEQTLAAQLAKHQLKPADIGYVIHTHLHMDHAGQDYLLPSARILIQRKELQNAAAPNFFPAPFYDRINVARLIDPLWHQVDILDGEGEVLPGIRSVLMPGHTPAHQAIYVELKSGTAIIAGDAAMNVAVNVRKQVAPGIVDNMADVMDSLRRLAKEDAKGMRVLPTHDPEVFDLYPGGIG